MEAEVRTETYGAVAVVDSVADGVNQKCLDLAEVTAEVTEVTVAVMAVTVAGSDTEGDLDNGKNYRTFIATGTKGI